MTSVALKSLLQAVSVVALVGTMSACNRLTQLSEIGSGPQMSGIQDPTQKQGYQPVSMPMPQAVNPPQNANSLWRQGAKALFKDNRAKEKGDILTVSVAINNENANFQSSLTRAKDNKESAGVTNFLGFESGLSKILPNGVDPKNLVGVGATSGTQNKGSTSRSESLMVNVGAVITQILPNGNLVISGKQQIRVNYEMRELSVEGIIRPEDISSSNSVTSDKIAEARIYYGGRGSASDGVTEPGWGTQVWNSISPF